MRSIQRLSLKALAVASMIVLASCGGGDDDEAGAPAPLNVVPTTFGYSGDGTNCAMGTAADRLIINGGAAPYRVESTSPGVATLYVGDNVAGRSETVTGVSKGGSVRVYFEGGCTAGEGISVLVKDALNVLVTVTIKNTREASTS